MRTRQLRLMNADAMTARLPLLIGRELQIVMKDNTVLPGTLKAFTGTMLQLLNMRRKVCEIPIASITEIYFDSKEC